MVLVLFLLGFLPRVQGAACARPPVLSNREAHELRVCVNVIYSQSSLEYLAPAGPLGDTSDPGPSQHIAEENLSALATFGLTKWPGTNTERVNLRPDTCVHTQRSGSH